MGVTTMILGESGRGKSRSIKNLNPEETLVIKSVKKPFPFPTKDWKSYDKETKTGSVISTDDYEVIKRVIKGAKSLGKNVIVIDDAQYLMANEFMRKSAVKGFEKFTELAKNMWELLNAANDADDDLRVYLLQHTETNSDGSRKAKTIGKMLDEKITIEGKIFDKGVYCLI